jgi:hypothetical protein
MVEGEGPFTGGPWNGPPWNGYITNCGYYFDGKGPFRCDGWNQGFEAKSAVLLAGRCNIDYSGYPSSAMESGKCYRRPSIYDPYWYSFTCND